MVKKMVNNEEIEDKTNSVLYVSKLPYGFTDKEARVFFEQFGKVKGVCYPKSKKTARSKGYMFVLFESKEIASIAAKSFNGYYFSGKSINCQVVDQSKPILYSKFKEIPKKFKFIPKQKMFIKSFNTKTDLESTKSKLLSMVEKDNEKIKKLKSLGINYDFPTYVDTLKQE